MWGKRVYGEEVRKINKRVIRTLPLLLCGSQPGWVIIFFRRLPKIYSVEFNVCAELPSKQWRQKKLKVILSSQSFCNLHSWQQNVSTFHFTLSAVVRCTVSQANKSHSIKTFSSSLIFKSWYPVHTNYFKQILVTRIEQYRLLIMGEGKYGFCVEFRQWNCVEPRKSLIRNWWPTKCNSLFYLFVINQLYMFRETFSPIIRSTWLYLQLLI